MLLNGLFSWSKSKIYDHNIFSDVWSSNFPKKNKVIENLFQKIIQILNQNLVFSEDQQELKF
jgi:hypothetical protein